jgi:hypothetical protein
MLEEDERKKMRERLMGGKKTGGLGQGVEVLQRDDE